jgi:2-amino-4-hydroxy-6-hydroxymethyldihydropteridine diphosphokinase
MAGAFIAVGSNIAPAENVRRAILLLAREARIRGISTVFRTAPEGRPEQPDYYNCVLRIDTDLAPLELKLRVLRGIEARLGRERGSDKYAARPIDLDLILYDEQALQTEELNLPDPHIRERAYIAAGVAELAPGMTLPGWRATIEEIRAGIPACEMAPLPDYTATLREAVLEDPDP